MTSKRNKFRDHEYRAAYAEQFLDTLIASQLRVLRQQRNLKQEELAALAGMRQSRISAMEDVNYSSWNVRTLKRLARALDLALIVKFESFGGLIGETTRLDRDRLERASFSEDPFFYDDQAAGSESTGNVGGRTDATSAGTRRVGSASSGKILWMALQPSHMVKRVHDYTEGVEIYGS